MGLDPWGGRGESCTLGRGARGLLAASPATSTIPSWPRAHSAAPSCLLAASYADRVTFSYSGITFHSVTRKDTGTYTCMVSDDGGNMYGEVSVQLTVLGRCPRVFCVGLEFIAP